MDETVKDLNSDLVRKFQRHGSRVEQMWRALGRKQREEVMRDGARDGVVLGDPGDTSMGNVYKFLPEWNIRDITSPSSDFLLELLRHRATTSLEEQYARGVNGHLGDYAHIVEMMQKRNLRPANASEFNGYYTVFIGERYGQSFKFDGGKDPFLTGMLPARLAQHVVPQAVGNLILMRQMYLLQALNIVIEDILDTASTTRTQSAHTKRPTDVATAALAKLSFHSPPKQPQLSDLNDSCLDQKSSLEDYMDLVSTEPTVLAHEVNFWFFTQPELIADETGRTLPVHTDKFIGGAVFDAVHGTVKAAAVWNYILRILALLKGTSDKQLRAILLQELSSTCYLEYTRTQAILKRAVSAGLGGSKWFRRNSTVRKDKVVRISVKRNPESLTVENPQLHYLLRLCQDETNWSRSAEWLQKLEDLHRTHPLEKDSMTKREFDSLGDLAVIVTFIQSLSSVEQLPTVNHKKEQAFISGCSALENELGQLKNEVDLGEFAIPIDNLLEPGMAVGAVRALDAFLLEKTGTKLNFLYQDLIDDCVSNISKQYEQRKMKSGEAKAEYVVPTAPESSELRIQQRRQKMKTRPAQPSLDHTTPEAATVTFNEKLDQPKEVFRVKASTFNVFSSLLLRSSAARGSVSWDAFAAAMVDIGFSMVPKVGSIYTFVPPETMAVQRPLTLHRPHQSCIEGPCLLVYSRRLKRVYGWGDSTFVVS